MQHWRILLDLDGTVAQNAGRRLAADQFGVRLDDAAGVSLPEQLGLTPEEFWAWWHANQEEIYNLAVPLEGSAAVLRALHGAGAYICVVTARRSEAEQVTRAWLDRHGFPYDHMVFASDNKCAVAQTHNLNLGFEDDPANAVALADLMPMVLIENFKNRGEEITHPGVLRVSGWNEVPALMAGLVARSA